MTFVPTRSFEHRGGATALAAALTLALSGLVAVLTIVPAAAATGDIAVTQRPATWLEAIYGPFHPQTFGHVSVEPANYHPGDTVTISVTTSAAVTSCTTPNGYTAYGGATGVTIGWNGPQADVVSYAPTALGGEFQEPTEDGWFSKLERFTSVSAGSSADQFFAPGTTFTKRVVVPTGSSGRGPAGQISVARLPVDFCDGTSTSGPLRVTGAGFALDEAPPPSSPPAALFAYEVSPTTFGEVTFDNRSTDDVDGPDELEYAWTFGDDSTSAERDPVHTYAHPGTYHVTLEVTDRDGQSTTRTADVVIGGLVVNSTGDSPASDPAQGCDTGGTVGDAPECTLRAAIESANAGAGDEITFAIEGSGVPTIALDSALPAVTADDVSIDGGTQEAGRVAIDGGGLDDYLLTSRGDGARVTGLAIDDGDAGIRVASGSAEVFDNVLGADPTATTAGTLAFGIAIDDGAGASTAVHDNVVVAGTGIESDASGVQITDNLIGTNGTGSAALGDTTGGIAVLGSNTTVDGNTVRADTVGILVLELDSASPAGGVTVTHNRVGVARDGATVLDDIGHGHAGEGIRIDGAPAATVSDNAVVSGGEADIAVTGRREATVDGQQLQYRSFQGGSTLSGPVTGGSATITGNAIGSAAAGTDDLDDPADFGVLAWGDAPDVEVRENRIAGQSKAGVTLAGGGQHVVGGNRIGDDSDDQPHAITSGIQVLEAPKTVIGGGAGANQVRTTRGGVVVAGVSSETSVDGNVVVGESEAGSYGILINADVPGLHVGSNRIQDVATGVDAEGPDVVVDGNVVVSTSGRALLLAGERPTATRNLVGAESPGASPVGNDGNGIEVTAGPAQLNGNEVVDSGGDGIVVDDGVVATLKGNRIAETTGRPIAAPTQAPAAPTVSAAIDTSVDDSDRTTLVVTGLPSEQATVEVFANGSCDSGEAERVLGVRKPKPAGTTHAIVQLIDRHDMDQFTVTVTDGDGRTSALSTCESISSYPDSDGDGSPDPLDQLIGSDADPAQAVLITDTGELLAITVAPADEVSGLAGGTLSHVGAVDDPAPGAHPNGMTLPYGAITFTIEGVGIGGTTGVSIFSPEGDHPIRGESYYKYGAPAPGAAIGWFPFDLDTRTGTGAVLGGLGNRRVFALTLRDGARGDLDGTRDGRIVDPGGPAISETPADDAPVSATAAIPVADMATENADTDADTVSDEALPDTGAPVDAILGPLALLLLAAGARLVSLGRRRRFG